MAQANELPAEEDYGITDEDRQRMAQLAEKRSRWGEATKNANHGIDGGGVTMALDRCPDDFTTTHLFVAAWLFENGASTTAEVCEATGVSQPTVSRALEGLTDANLAHNESQRTFEGRGRRPTVYVPCPHGVPASHI